MLGIVNGINCDKFDNVNKMFIFVMYTIATNKVNKDSITNVFLKLSDILIFLISSGGFLARTNKIINAITIPIIWRVDSMILGNVKLGGVNKRGFLISKSTDALAVYTPYFEDTANLYVPGDNE